MSKQPNSPLSQANGNLVTVTPGKSVQLLQHANNADYTRDGVDLVVTEENNVTRYENFFAQGEANELPDLILEDGTVIAGKDFLQAQNPDMELTTAAGPEGQTENTNGLSDYTDGAGALVDGIDRLDSLGATGQWTYDGTTTETLFSAASESLSSTMGNTFPPKQAAPHPAVLTATPNPGAAQKAATMVALKAVTVATMAALKAVTVATMAALKAVTAAHQL